MPKVKTTSVPRTPATSPANGASTQPGPQAGTPGSPVVAGTPGTIATTGTSGFDYLGWFTVDDEGCTVQFGIEQQKYVLPATSPNYNAMFSMLLAAWLDRHKVNLTYASPLVTGPVGSPDGPLRILSLVTI